MAQNFSFQRINRPPILKRKEATFPKEVDWESSWGLFNPFNTSQQLTKSNSTEKLGNILLHAAVYKLLMFCILKNWIQMQSFFYTCYSKTSHGKQKLEKHKPHKAWMKEKNKALTTLLKSSLIHIAFKHFLLRRKIPYTHQSRMKM